MKNKIKKIDGKLLLAILNGAKVIKHAKIGTETLIAIEHGSGFFIKERNQLVRYDYLLFRSKGEGPFIQVGGYVCRSPEMHHIFNAFLEVIEEQKRKPK